MQAACFRAYNDWLIEYCQVAPERLLEALAGLCEAARSLVGHAEQAQDLALEGADAPAPLVVVEPGGDQADDAAA